MASPSSNTNPSKKRHSFLNHFLSPKNQLIFRNKPLTRPKINTIYVSNDAQCYESQININTQQQQQQIPAPMCIGRGWLKKRLKRPVSLDLDLLTSFTHESTNNNNNNNNNNRQLPVEEHQQSLNDIGNNKEKNPNKSEILVTKQKVDMSIQQTGKYLYRHNIL